MLLQISYDFSEIEEAIKIARLSAQFADIIEVGAPMIYRNGVSAVREFRKAFPNKKILADTKLLDRVGEIIPDFAESADFVTILAGAKVQIAKKAAGIVSKYHCKLVIDMIDACSMGQVAMDAKAIGADYIVLHTPHEQSSVKDMISDWQAVKGNATVPVFLAGGIDLSCIDRIKNLGADGVVIGTAINKSDDPEGMARQLRELVK